MKNNVKTIRKVCALVITVVLCLIVFGCGKKGDPIYPVEVLQSPAVVNLTARATGGFVTLEWAVTGGDVERFRILRSEAKEENFCPACPRTFFMTQEVSIGDSKLTRKGENAFSCSDTNIRKGYHYSYKIIACTSSNVCSDESEIVEVAVK